MTIGLRRAMDDARATMLRDAISRLPPEYHPAQPGEPMCLASHPDGFKCTCRRGHGGLEHVALGNLGQICEKWSK